MKVKLEKSWSKRLRNEMERPYFVELKKFVREEYENNTVYPPAENLFEAFNLTPFEKVKIVILGQDPYHGPKQAHGLCFSVNRGITPPPSLRNIYKEIKNDLGIEPPDHGNLTKWAKQGVLLLNAILTVKKKSPGSHKNMGWEQFTDSVIQILSDERENIVFMLWGNFAKGKSSLIDENKHLILKAPHPSPYSANSGFFGCKHFSRANNYLKKQNKKPVDWNIN